MEREGVRRRRERERAAKKRARAWARRAHAVKRTRQAGDVRRGRTTARRAPRAGGAAALQISIGVSSRIGVSSKKIRFETAARKRLPRTQPRFSHRIAHENAAVCGDFGAKRMCVYMICYRSQSALSPWALCNAPQYGRVPVSDQSVQWATHDVQGSISREPRTVHAHPQAGSEMGIHTLCRDDAGGEALC